MQEIIRQLLAELGEDPAREGLRDTPKRVEKALRFLTSGYTADVDATLNNALFSVDYNEMVIVKDIDFYSLCEHHLLPFFGTCHIAYIPQGRMRGVEKQNSFAVTSAMLGVFRDDARTRMEFLELIKRPELHTRRATLPTPG